MEIGFCPSGDAPTARDAPSARQPGQLAIADSRSEWDIEQSVPDELLKNACPSGEAADQMSAIRRKIGIQLVTSSPQQSLVLMSLSMRLKETLVSRKVEPRQSFAIRGQQDFAKGTGKITVVMRFTHRTPLVQSVAGFPTGKELHRHATVAMLRRRPVASSGFLTARSEQAEVASRERIRPAEGPHGNVLSCPFADSRQLHQFAHDGFRLRAGFQADSLARDGFRQFHDGDGPS